MTLAKFILSQNVRRVRVCNRHFPFPPGTAKSRTAICNTHGGRLCFWCHFLAFCWLDS